MTYLLPVMIPGRVRRPPRGPNKYTLFTTMEAEGDGWKPVKITKDNHSPAKEQTAPSRVYCSQNSGHLAYVKIFQEAADLSEFDKLC